jgi:hypothetical protein
MAPLVREERAYLKSVFARIVQKSGGRVRLGQIRVEMFPSRLREDRLNSDAASGVRPMVEAPGRCWY